MKKGLIIVNSYTESETELNQSERLKSELEKLGVRTDIKRNNTFFAYVNENGESVITEDYDFCVYLDKDKYVSALLEKCGMRLFNSHAAIQACDDKMETSILLSNRNIPMPKTLPGLLCYNPSKKIEDETLDRIGRSLGYPLVVKTSYGSLGKGVYKADDKNALRKLAEELKCTQHLFQQFIRESAGRDLRVIVIGGKYVAAMLRQSDGDFRSNLELGGVGIPITPQAEIIDVCERAANVLGLDYCGIDVLIGADKFYVCEVNSNAFFGGIEKVTKVNIAEKYSKYIYDRIYR